MKTATIPALRVEPDLRAAAEAVLQEGETLSSFVEQSLQANIQRRMAQQAFIERGLAARESARENDEYFDAADVLSELDAQLAQAKPRAKSKPQRK